MLMLSTKKNINLTAKEQKDLILMCTKIDYHIPAEVTVIKNKALSRNKGKGMALFHILHPDVIFICADERDWRMLLPKIDHELVHRAQYYRYKFFVYCFLSTVLWRKWTIEPEAYASERSINLRFNSVVQGNVIANGRWIKREYIQRRSS